MTGSKLEEGKRREKTDREAHRVQHARLHAALDELVADWMVHTNKTPSQATIADLIRWSADQTYSPTEVRQ